MSVLLDSTLNAGERFTAICHIDDILPNTGVAALVENQAIAVFRVGEQEFFAIGNVDPFSGASVLSRGIVGDVAGAPVVASPIYKQHFRLEDGMCVEDESKSVPVFAVMVTDGVISVGPA